MNDLYTSKNPLVRFVHTNRLKKIVETIKYVSNKKILDAGCGEGHLLQLIEHECPDNQYYGFDISSHSLRIARIRSPFAELTQQDITNIKLPSNSYDIIVCSEVIEHIIDYKKAIQELKRILKPDGVLILTFPNEVLWTMSRALLLRNPIKIPDHYNSFNPKYMEAMIGKRTKQENLPFGLPFSMSLTCLMVLHIT